MAQRPEQLLARIWMEWEYFDRMKMDMWNPTVSLFEDVKAWALSSPAFVPREPVVIHGPLPKDLPEFEGIDYPIGGKPEEKRK